MKLLLAVIFILSTISIVESKEIIVDCDSVRNDEKICLACNIYHEARNQSKLGQYMVGKVTLNRKESNLFPNTICEVVWQKNSRGSAQFSWTSDGALDYVLNEGSWDSAMNIAVSLFSEELNTRYFDDIYWFHAVYVNPYWSKEKKFVMKVGDHLFYK